jgi:hypothetical protein
MGPLLMGETTLESTLMEARVSIFFELIKSC